MPAPRTVQKLPDTYQETFFLRVTDRRKILFLNVGAIGLLVISLLFFMGLLVGYHALGAPLVNENLPGDFPLLIQAVILIGMMPVHEWIHGLAMQYFGHPVRYGIKPLKGVLYATSDGAYFWRRQFIIVALAPLGVISLAAVALSLVFPVGTAIWFMFAAVLNATGSIGDLWMVRAVRHSPADVLVRDEEDGMRVFSHT